MYFDNDKPVEECGIFGIYDRNGGCARITYYGLIALQHRGQESCGIAVNKNRDINYYKDSGLVSEVFSDERIEKLDGNMAVGHVRYATAGGSSRENAQPLVLHYQKGNLAIAHNGSLVNANALRKEYNSTGAIYQTNSDSEIIAYTIARQRILHPSIEDAINASMKIIKGAYSLIIMSPKKLIAVRDPMGFRPLCMGRDGDRIVFASESCAFDPIGVTFERELLPGEIVIVEDGNVRCIRDNCGQESKLCIFEYIYFARADSMIEGQQVYESRVRAGKILAKEHPVEADIVTGVPDSALGAAIGFSRESGIPYEMGFVKNSYIGRTFIRPSQQERETAVTLKLNVLKSAVAGKRVVMVDDSIVRGTNSVRIVRQLREAGATEVHVRISSPQYMWPCYYGTDIASRSELMAYMNSVDETRKLIGADSLGYLSLSRLYDIVPNAKCGFCDACFTGNYPVGLEN